MREDACTSKLTCDHVYADQKKCNMFFKFEGTSPEAIEKSITTSGWIKVGKKHYCHKHAEQHA